MRIKLNVIEQHLNEEVEVAGWIEDKRILGKIMFITLRDGTGKTQLTVSKDDDLWNILKDVPRQSAIRVRGIVRRYKDTVEIKPMHVKVESTAKHPLPLDPSGRTPAMLSVILNARALSLRVPEIKAIFRLRSKVTNLIREFFSEIKDCTEVHTPKIIASGTEGGADLFQVDYFGKVAFLAQSPQLYKEQLMLGLDCVYEIAPYFRAEKSHTRKHLNEFISVDLEVAFQDYKGVMKILEELINYVLEEIKRKGKEEFEVLKYTPPEPPGDIPILTYDEILKMLDENGIDVTWGEEVPTEHLEHIYSNIGDFYFIIDWPWDIKPFYIMRKGDKLSESFDLMYREIELSSGGTREHRRIELEKNLVAKGLDPKKFEFHLKFFDYGMPPHAGFGLGLDRLMLVVTGRENIREVVLYPRDPERLTP